MLSAFGQFFEERRIAKGLSKRQVAKLVDVSSSKLTETLRDREWAKQHKKRWYGPDLDTISKLAHSVGITGEDRKKFIHMAELEHAPAGLREYVNELEEKVRKLKAELERLERQ